MEECNVRAAECDELKDSKERGASLVEYAVLVGIILTVAVLGVQVFGGNVSTAFNRVGTNLLQQVPGGGGAAE